MAEEKKERKGRVVQLSGTAYIQAGAFFKAKDRPEITKKLNEALEELRKKKEKDAEG